MRLPEWATDPQLSPDERQRMIVKYHLLRAAAFHNPKGSIVQLSLALDMDGGALHTYINRGGTTRKVALALEALLGADVITRAQAAPEIFDINDESEEHY